MKKYHVKNIDDEKYAREYTALEQKFLFKIGFALRYQLILPVLKRISREQSVIDIGCAHGFFLNYLLKNGYYNLFGMDLKNELYENVASSPKVTFIEQTILHPQATKEGPFEVLHISGMLHHLPPDKLCLMPGIMAGMLTEGGTVFIYEPNRFSRIGMIFYEHFLPLLMPLLYKLSESEVQIQRAFCSEMPAFMEALKKHFEIISYSDRWFYYAIIAQKR